MLWHRLIYNKTLQKKGGDLRVDRAKENHLLMMERMSLEDPSVNQSMGASIMNYNYT